MFCHCLYDGVHKYRRILIGEIGKNKMIFSFGNDLVAREHIHQVLIDIIQCVFGKKWRSANRYHSMVIHILILEIYVEDACHLFQKYW